MREFWTYTGLRILLFLATFAVVFGVWAAVDHGDVNIALAVIVAFVISAPASYVLLNRPRAAFASKVEDRATRMVERARSKEDV